jgi:alpha-glucosidase (family GH31 glycosyl hydrolase)
MKHSIAGVMNFNMFGIPLTGPETCGFFGTDLMDELCGRWIQLATFYPLAR